MQSYATRQDLAPPSVTVTTDKPGTAPGLVFLAPKGGRGQDGPMIIDNRGKLVWFKAMKGKVAADFRVQTYLGKPVLTWWEGQLFVGDGDGVGQVYDSSYKPIAQVHAGNGYSFDLHEFTITPRNTALVLAYERYKRSLKAWGGPRTRRSSTTSSRRSTSPPAWCCSSGTASATSRPTSPTSRRPRTRARSGSTSTPTRSTSTMTATTSSPPATRRTIYKIDRSTGKIIWRLGGKKSDFKLGKGVRFDWQHSIRSQPDGTYKVYDNSAAPPVAQELARLTLKLDAAGQDGHARERVRRTRASCSRPARATSSALPNGNTFVGWGSQRWFTEFSPTGKVLFDGHLARGNDNYRAFRFEWTGRPASRRRSSPARPTATSPAA